MDDVKVCLGIVLLCLAGSATAKEKKTKPGPLTGTWQCTSHGGPQGDMPFTLHLEQTNEAVRGSVESPIGGTEISSGSFKHKTIELQINTDQGDYHLTGKLKAKQLGGQWYGRGDQKGTWEGKKMAVAKP